MTRTSHALATSEGVWLVDPVDWPEAIDRAASLGTPAGVIQLLDRHNRDGAAVAERLGVPHLVVPGIAAGNAVRGDRDQARETLAGGRALVAGAADARRRRGARHEPVLPDRRRPGRRPPAPEADAAAPAARLRAGAPARRPRRGRPRAEATIALQQALSRSRLSVVRWAVSLPFRMRKNRPERADAGVDARLDASALAPASPGRTSRARPLQARVAHRRVERLGQRRGAERAPHLRLGRRAVGRRPLARHPAGRADHAPPSAPAAAPAPTPSRPRARSTRSSACRRGR